VVEAEAYIDVVDRWPDLGTVFFSERNHITCVTSGYVSKDLYGSALTPLSRYSDREELIPNSSTNSPEKFWISINLVYLVRIRHLLVIGSIASWVLPVNVLG
jgi:hypothetical protein